MVPKIKSRRSSQKYLNFGFTTTEVNDVEKKPLLGSCRSYKKKNIDDIFLTSRELNQARDASIRQTQTQEFYVELKALRLGNNILPHKPVVFINIKHIDASERSTSATSPNVNMTQLLFGELMKQEFWLE
ncbi:hypothetical protein TNCV_2909801 [Trichonephila clavipes]|nr:hypothetical protein TNCV_2909801 [Trichonephila clavipes]